jgi:glycosyltransferase involved in cell wall biosynthesis
MKILVISQRYWPDPFRISDTCEELVKRGNSVTVVCQSAKLSASSALVETESHNGVYLIRVKAHPRKSGSLNLFNNYRSFSRNTLEVTRSLPDDFDAVLVNGLSPIMAYESGLEYAERFHKKTLLYCLDLWPVSLAVRNVNERGITRPVYQHYLHKAKDIYNRFDRILISSPSYESYLNSVCGVPSSKIALLYQYADGVFLPNPPHLVRSNDLVFTGNIGKAQDIETLIRAAKLVEQELPLHFHFYGSGSDYKNSQSLAQRYHCINVFFHGQRPTNEIPEILARADGTLLSLQPGPLSDLVIPAKLQTYMAAGKPVIACAGHSVNDVIRDAGCGWCVPAGDSEGLAKAFVEFNSASFDQIQTYGNNAKRYSKENFDREAFFQSLIKELYNLCEPKIPASGENRKD